jgi:glyoxylase-like metal-dependent hydrolase (beta-lactamase superfamily II)
MAEPMTAASTRIGDLRVDPVLDGSRSFVPTKSFRQSTPESWEVHRDLLNDEGRLEFALGGFLVRTADRVALVDLGAGPRTVMGIEGGQFVDHLRELGVGPLDVTDVVFTHLHHDHIGWAVIDGRPVFRNAVHRCAAADWQHFMVDNPGREYQMLEPVIDRFDCWTGDGPLFAGVSAVAAPGHTPGSTVISLRSGPDRAVLLGDIAHCPVELIDDEWPSIADLDRDGAKRTKNALSRALEGTDILIGAAHFPGLRFGRLLKGDGKRRWVPA